MGCDTCKARNRCETYIQPGSIMCVIYQMQEGGTKGEQDQRQPKFCPYCGKPLKIIGTERFCDNMKCWNVYKPMGK